MASLEQINPKTNNEASEAPKLVEEYKVAVLYSLLKVVEYLLLAAARVWDGDRNVSGEVSYYCYR
ncbi:MAG: hypothetical protein KA714_13355 [Limnoraphis sp. WC205]|nr:hypothetical protein [Limnoraphis sp. WC205]